MCDTFVYRSEDKPVSRIWFGKNSDREPNEAHEVLFVKGKNHLPGTRVKCTYIEIPQVSLTHDVVLCKPAWMWGAEMGVNSFGVVIGNEALFTKGNPPKDPALTGMDLLRLALERSVTARNALDCIISLLTEYGQGGNCGYNHEFYYNNSFLIADHHETWVLESIGKDWAARKYLTSTSISNALTIHSEWDEVSSGLISTKDLAYQKSDPIITLFSQAVNRRACVLDGLYHIPPDVSILEAFHILRSHGDSGKIPTDSMVSNPVCMHAGFGPIRIDQTTGSMVADLTNDNLTIWITGTSSPCLSVFHPISFKDFQNDVVISSESEWWKNEMFHRNAIFCPEGFVRLFAEERDHLEAGFVKTILQDQSSFTGISQVDTNTRKDQRNEFLARWSENAVNEKKVGGHYLYRKAWQKFNKEANLRISL